MLKRSVNHFNQLALRVLGRPWLDYIASNTMTEFNRRHNDFVWTYDLKALVVGIRDEAPGVKTFTLLPNQHWRSLRAGQHLEVSAMVDGQVVSRYYSLSPMERGRFTITVKRTAQGVLSNWLHRELKVGQTLKIGHPEGQFTYQGQSKLLFICAGSGITPCYSMIKERLQAHDRVDLAMYAQFAKVEDTIFSQTLQDWKGRFDVRLAYDQEPHHPGQLLHARKLSEQYPDLHERDVYLCGPQGFMDNVIAQLQAEGFDLSRLHCERFVAQNFEAPAAEFDVTGAEVYFKHLNAHVCLGEADRGKTLLEIAESRDLHPEVGCRQGMCGTCKLTLTSGQAAGNVLGQAVYLCTAYPASHKVVLDA